MYFLRDHRAEEASTEGYAAGGVVDRVCPAADLAEMNKRNGFDMLPAWKLVQI